MLENKKAVIFDLDGTLTDSMWVWDEIDQEFFRSRNMEFPTHLKKDLEGMSFTETAAYFVQTYSLDCTAEELGEYWNQRALSKYRTEIFLKPGALRLLQYLHGNSIKAGIATSNSELLVNTFLSARGIEGYIQAITTDQEVKRGKPAPDVYLVTAEKLGVRPEDCLVFEDIPMGILAGKNAGMEVCAVEDPYSAKQRGEKQALADYYIEDFRDLSVELSSIRKGMQEECGSLS